MSILQMQYVTGRVHRVALQNRHGFKRIAEVSAAVTADAVTATCNREYAAQVAMVTTEEEFE
jgi:hypothetical protein